MPTITGYAMTHPGVAGVGYAPDLATFYAVYEPLGWILSSTPPSAGPEIYDPRDYGAFADGTTDDTAAWQDCYADLPEGATMLVPPGQSVVGGFQIRKAMTLRGGGVYSQIIPPSTSSGWCLELLGTTGAETLDNDCLYGVTLENFSLRGRARTVDWGGIRIRDAQRCRVDGVQIANFQRSGLYLSRRVRNMRFFDVVMKGCGDLAGSYPAQLLIDSVDVSDGHNNLSFVGLESVNPYGDHVLLRKSNATSSIRNLFFESCMFHGVAPGDGVFGSYEEDLTADYRNVGRVHIQNARNTFFKNCRFQTSGPGHPLILSREYAGVTSVNGCVVSGASLGGVESFSATFTRSSNNCTMVGHNLATGAMVRVSSSGTLPTGLSAATDYWVIRVDADNVSLATTRANAEAGTAITLSSAGTGTHTMTAQECKIYTDLGQVQLVDSITEGTVNRKAVIVAGTGTATLGPEMGFPGDYIEGSTAASSTWSFRKIKAADETVNNSATLQNDDHLSFAIAASETWTFQFRLYVTGDATADFRVGVTWPTGATATVAVHGSRAADALVSALDGTSTSGTAIGQIGADTGPRLVVVTGTIENSTTAGTVQLQWAQQAATVANTTVKRGSVLVAERIS